jgi:hypothetical protein
MELPSSYLSRQTSYEDAIRDNMYEGREFGYANDDWERLKAKIQPSDEFWYFEPPSPSALQFWGVALVRDGKIVSTVLTSLT